MNRSHLLGTVPHGHWGHSAGYPGSDKGVDPRTWENLLANGYGLTPIELEPGDMLLFTGNTIHGAADNLSDRSRLAMIAT